MKLNSVGLVINYEKEKAQEITNWIVDWLSFKKIKVYVEGGKDKGIRRKDFSCTNEKFFNSVDLIISLGGDGTLLRAAKIAATDGIPIFGVNLGGLGFLTQIGIDNLEIFLEKIYQGKCFLDERMMLDGIVKRKEKEIKKFTALNDIVIGKGAFARLISLATYINDDYVITYSADGLVISTSTGSTAYSLSAGGPIVNPNINSMILTPICPHTLSTRPLIIGENDQVRITLELSEEEVMVTIDGQEGFTLEPKDEVIVKKSIYKTRLIAFKEKSFYAILREKLRWSGQVNK
ncbi:MAG: NAD(+) kinase [Candidatus Infernicultor aquiphilus]|uniref:NAD kinase n=1 Tax=Candidatus Infernicultor aquiphilus TaxID=1805029 RepID=A0A2M8CDC3_9BACT|nr:NAD(+)/NADH kinase [bacterium]PIU25446.1 MAG: NAD(+) kinase [Candidatus Atribacteria bacterium CG08_land_8_20_14_0_20_33_29]PIW11447.1 MAG: NAD(+) kinase [Candidatus Atribacteria bacterium CG17_big_fil_post_rev_8_21_14_2_50_34_11]PIX35260.1 MAG: NAD(+) kinase [Candidatus Atribacteria bacterium CG_4_8_14_3_um_filter_34_18]PIY31183.1 MAG: NAD(+) kinase [Candidatus Atribacteria bacterium CG_4_10_14_3_um_filter_34_13]PJB57073.1 MAG: NAD(+) kinase [Candidatus Atribacteria bacterium CG_4_9_14_3_u